MSLIRHHSMMYVAVKERVFCWSLKSTKLQHSATLLFIQNTEQNKIVEELSLELLLWTAKFQSNYIYIYEINLINLNLIFLLKIKNFKW